jgi:hypothetical protein
VRERENFNQERENLNQENGRGKRRVREREILKK